MGTYGSFTQPFRGFSVSQDCSVGFSSDHEAEGREFRELKLAARERLRSMRDPDRKSVV